MALSHCHLIFLQGFFLFSSLPYYGKNNGKMCSEKNYDPVKHSLYFIKDGYNGVGI